MRDAPAPEIEGGAQSQTDSRGFVAPALDVAPVGGAHVDVDGQEYAAPTDDLFKLVYRLVEDLQRVRLSHGNRIRQVLPKIPAHVNPPRGTPTWEAFFKVSADILDGEEHRVLKLAERLLKDDPIGRWMLAQKGIGPSLALSILGECWPLSRFASPRKLWAFAGMAVDAEGKAVRRHKGQRANWNGRLKTRLWIFSGSALKAGGPWRDVYDQRKAYEYARVGAQLNADGQDEGAPDPDDAAGAQPAPDSQGNGAPSLGDAGGAQSCLDGHIVLAPAGGAQDQVDSQRVDAPAGAQGSVDGHLACEPGGDAHGTTGDQPGRALAADAQVVADRQRRNALGGAQESPDSQPRSEPADHELGDAHTCFGVQAAGALSKFHLHNRALRVMQKALLKDLWRVAHGQEPLVGTNA